VVFCLYPETSRRTLEDMDEIFINYPGLLVFGKSTLTQRERPQAFIDAESARIAAISDAKETGELHKSSGVAHEERV
jgi:hypothetical protein